MPPTNLDISNNILMYKIDQKMMSITLMKLTSIQDYHVHLNQKEQFDFFPIIKCKKENQPNHGNSNGIIITY